MGVTYSAMGRNAKARGIDGDGGYDIVKGHHYVGSYIVLVIYAILGTEEQSIRMRRVSIAGGGRTRPLPSRRCIVVVVAGVLSRRNATFSELVSVGPSTYARTIPSTSPWYPRLYVLTYVHYIVCSWYVNVGKITTQKCSDTRETCRWNWHVGAKIGDIFACRRHVADISSQAWGWGGLTPPPARAQLTPIRRSTRA